MIPIVVFFSCVLATFFAYWLLMRKSTHEQQMLQKRLSGVLDIAEGAVTPASQFIRRDLLSEVPSANRLLGRWFLARKLSLFIQQAGLRLTVMRLLLFAGLAALGGLLIASLLADSLIPRLICALAASSLPFVFVWYKRKNRLHQFLTQLPEGLDLMSRALSAGHAFTESMHMVSTEMPEPLAGEFAATYEAQKLGLSYKIAMKHLTMRVPLLELRLCVTAILIQRETGGNLAEILDRVAITIRERFKILEDLNTLTTASRLSAWLLCALPIIMLGIITVINPDYLDPLWRDPRGHRLLWIAAGMQVMGMLVVRKIMQIKI